MAEDLRSLLDPLAVVRAARPQWREVPERIFTPAPTEEVPDPEPVVVPGYTEAYTDPADLPDVIADEGIDLAAQIALVQAALAQLTDKRTRVAVGRITLTSGTYQAGATIDLPIVFDEPALAVPESGWVQVQPGVAWMGRTRAVVLSGSITATGCTVRVTVIAATVPSSAQPITYEAVCIYSYAAPFQE